MLGCPALLKRHAFKRLLTAKNNARVTIPRKGTGQPRLVNPRNMDIIPKSSSTFHSESCLWRPSSGSGLSMLRSGGSADGENYGRRKELDVVSVRSYHGLRDIAFRMSHSRTVQDKTSGVENETSTSELHISAGSKHERE